MSFVSSHVIEVSQLNAHERYGCGAEPPIFWPTPQGLNLNLKIKPKRVKDVFGYQIDPEGRGSHALSLRAIDFEDIISSLRAGS